MAQIMKHRTKHCRTSNTKTKQFSSSPFQWPESFLQNSVKCIEKKQKLNIHTFTCKYCLSPQVGTYDWLYSGRHYIINSSQSQGFL